MMGLPAFYALVPGTMTDAARIFEEIRYGAEAEDVPPTLPTMLGHVV